MNTSNRIGWWIVWLCVLSLVIDVLVCSIDGLYGKLDLRLTLLWTYVTLGALVVGIFMAQYTPYNPEDE